jgi:GTP pyrophosphokinase
MIVRGRDFTDIWDLVGIRILVDTVRDCYAALGIMHAHWQPVPGRFKDFVAMPKFNMYQSLHTTVIGPHGKPVELQIRTHDMHRTAEYGIAAHWKYKEKARSGGRPGPGEFGASKVGTPDDMLWLRQLLDWQREAQEPGEFLETPALRPRPAGGVRLHAEGRRGEPPGGATPVDFAYAVHTEVGHRCIGARVNGSLVSLDSKLLQRRRRRVFTSRSPTAGPSQDWLASSAPPARAPRSGSGSPRSGRDDAVEAGKEALTRAMRKAGLPAAAAARRRALRHPGQGPPPRRRHRPLRRGGEHQISAAIGRREADHRARAAPRAPARTSPRRPIPTRRRRPGERPAGPRESSSTA